MRRRFGGRKQLRLVPNYTVLTLLVLFAIVPLVVLCANSLKSEFELGQNFLGLPSSVQWENYPDAWVQGNFGTTMRNSLTLVVGAVLGVLVLGGLAAYSLARLNPPGAGIFTVYMLGLSSVPVWIYIIPLFMLLRRVGLLDSHVGLVILYIALNSPFAIFLLRSYLLQIPADFEDAARVDGANEWQVLARVVLPMVWPGFLTVGLVVALSVWSEFQLAYIFINDQELLPVTTSYYNFRRRFGQNWALTSAGAVMMIAPVVLIFLALQRRFIEGLTQGGIKA